MSQCNQNNIAQPQYQSEISAHNFVLCYLLVYFYYCLSLSLHSSLSFSLSLSFSIKTCRLGIGSSFCSPFPCPSESENARTRESPHGVYRRGRCASISSPQSTEEEETSQGKSQRRWKRAWRKVSLLFQLRVTFSSQRLLWKLVLRAFKQLASLMERH